MNYFKGCFKVEQIKKVWRKLAFENHPDRGGDTATMQDINAQYHDALKGKHGQTSYNQETQKEHTYYYNEKVEREVMEKVLELLGLKLEGVEVLLIGTWVWITGDTKPHKDKLGKNGAKCRWHGKRKAWYWRSAKNKCYRPSNTSLSGLAAAYGCESFDSMEQIA